LSQLNENLDDFVVCSFDRPAGGLWQVPASGGAPKALTMLDAAAGEYSHRLPQILPGGRAVMFTITRANLPTWDDTDVVVQSLATNERKALVQGAADAIYVPSGHLVYVRRGTLMAAPFDVNALAVSGGASSVINDLMQSANMSNIQLDSGAGQYSVSESGGLAYVAGGIYSFPDRSLVWVSRTGVVEPLAASPRVYIYPRLSPDGAKVPTQGDRNYGSMTSRAAATRV
jgi:serine/threonine-protein kinase